MRAKISLKFHVKTGAKNGKVHTNFTLLGRRAGNLKSERNAATLGVNFGRDFFGGGGLKP